VEKEIPLIEGTKIKMRIPAGVQPGKVLRVQGKGLSDPKGTRGNMMVEVQIVAQDLTPQQRELIEQARNLRNP
jgi:molecular chaperone DnaJ